MYAQHEGSSFFIIYFVVAIFHETKEILTELLPSAVCSQYIL
jgi:hypothetical protein